MHRILIDSYTYVRAAEELGLLRVTAYEKTFAFEVDALAYTIHAQRDRRYLFDADSAFNFVHHRLTFFTKTGIARYQ